MLERAAAGRAAVRDLGADPLDVLALVVWPSNHVVDVLSTEAAARSAASLRRMP
jgi:hypothetical protein